MPVGVYVRQVAATRAPPPDIGPCPPRTWPCRCLAARFPIEPRVRGRSEHRRGFESLPSRIACKTRSPQHPGGSAPGIGRPGHRRMPARSRDRISGGESHNAQQSQQQHPFSATHPADLLIEFPYLAKQGTPPQQFRHPSPAAGMRLPNSEHDGGRLAAGSPAISTEGGSVAEPKSASRQKSSTKPRCGGNPGADGWRKSASPPRAAAASALQKGQRPFRRSGAAQAGRAAAESALENQMKMTSRSTTARASTTIRPCGPVLRALRPATRPPARHSLKPPAARSPDRLPAGARETPTPPPASPSSPRARRTSRG